MIEAQSEIVDIDDNRRFILSRSDTGWLLVGVGVVGFAIGLVRDRHSFLGWMLPIGVAGAGVKILRGRRQKRLRRVERRILAELDSLDPIARVQVLAAVAKQQLPRGH